MPGRYERLFTGTIGIVIGVTLVVFVAMRFYTKWWRFTSLRDLQAILLATAGSSLILAALLRPGARTTSCRCRAASSRSTSSSPWC